MTDTQNEQNVQTPVTPAQDASATTPVIETSSEQTVPAESTPAAQPAPAAEPVPAAQPASAVDSAQVNQQATTNEEKQDGGLGQDVKE